MSDKKKKCGLFTSHQWEWVNASSLSDKVNAEQKCINCQKVRLQCKKCNWEDRGSEENYRHGDDSRFMQCTKCEFVKRSRGW